MLKERLEKQKMFLRIKLYIVSGGFLLLLILGFSLLIYWPYFRVKEFKVEGAKRINGFELVNDLQRRKLSNGFIKYLGFTNILFWGSGDVVTDNSLVKSLHTERDLWKRLVTINVKERSGEIIWCIGNEKCFWLDERGVAIEEAPFSDGQLLSTIYGIDNYGLRIGSSPISEELFLRIKKILKLIASSGVSLERFEVIVASSEARAKAALGPEMIFNLKIDPTFTESALSHLYKKAGFSKLNYIDFSVEDKVFYR